MITLKHILIYKEYNGDGDGFIRCATKEEKSILDYKHWSLIDNLVQDLVIVKNGFASETLISSIDIRLKENCENEETVQALKALVLKVT